MSKALFKIVLILLINTILAQGQNDEIPDDSKIDSNDGDLVEDTVLLNNSRNDTMGTEDQIQPEREQNIQYGATESADKLDESNDELTIPTTEIVTEYTLSMDVYKYNESDDSNNDEIETTSQPTTRSDAEADQSIDKEDLETPGLRSPKTENTEQQLPEQRVVEVKPRPLPTSRSSILKGWLEDTWLRPPAGILVPLRPKALNRALAVWKDLAVEGLNVSDIVIVGYDSNGVNWRSRHNLQPSNGVREKDVPEALAKLLLKYQGVRSDASEDGTMRALATAAKLVPYDSALFVITDKGPGDPQRLPLALRALVEKRLKVYTIWTDPNHPSVESEAALQVLRNISKHTEGDVLPYSMQVIDVDQNNLADIEVQPWVQKETLQARRSRVQVTSDYQFERFDTLLVRRGGGEAISLGLPIDSDVTSLKILLEGAVDHAVLYPPNEGPQIDLYNFSSIAAFSPGSRIERLSPREVFLIFPGAPASADALAVVPASTSSTPRSDLQAAMIGMWHLSVRCDTCDYRLCVSASSRIHLDVEVKDMLRLRVTGPVASVRESLLVDEFETELAKLSFSYQPVAGESRDVQNDSITELVADVVLPSFKGSKVYVKIVGRDIRGEPFVRLSGPITRETRQSRSASIAFPDDLELVEEENLDVYSRLRYNDSNVLPSSRYSNQVVNQQGTVLTAVNIGLSSRLYGSPGDNLQLHFEVSNFREQAVRFNFGAEGELRFLTGLSPTSQTIQPGQTVNVIVSLRIRTAAQPGARDLITFTAYGLDTVAITSYVYVTNPGVTVTDTWAPEVWHNFQGSCIGRQGSDCAQHVWSATIVARDTLGGLLRLTSSPMGLIYDSNYISGTREEIIATYRATCCNPRVVVTAVDTYGNVNSYVVDISGYFTGAAIAAIVLGVLIAILIILLIIYLIYYCVRRRKESRELPYSTSSRNIS